MTRPGVLRWIAYAFGVRLPVRYAPWVLHDLTCRTWFLRHLARSALQATPAAFLALLPGPVWLRLAMPLFVLFSTLFMATIFSPMVREKRLYQHGYLPEVVLRDEDR